MQYQDPLQTVIARPRKTGKTHDLVKLAAEKQYVIVAPNVDMIDYIQEIAVKLNVEIPPPITFSRFLSASHRGISEFTGAHYRGRRIEGFLIDNAECLLQRIAGTIPVVGFSYSFPAYSHQVKRDRLLGLWQHLKTLLLKRFIQRLS